VGDSAELRNAKSRGCVTPFGPAQSPLVVAYTLRRSSNAETIRIISARRASRRERAYASKD
jgi:uncharacterized DUF497 family protein